MTTGNSSINEHVTFTWRRDGAGWLLLAGRRRLSRVVPDSKYPGMFRPALSFGRLAGMANLSWAKSVTLDAATREMEHERLAATAPTKCPENEGVFGGASSPIAPRRQADAEHPTDGPTIVEPAE
jgi:hypothetical protein